MYRKLGVFLWRSEYAGGLKKVLVRAPDTSFGNADPKKWHYTGKPNLQNALKEHEAICEVLRKEGAEVIYHKEPLSDHADAIYVHDPVIWKAWVFQL